MSFVHLHVHTEYSTDGMSKIRDLFEKAGKLNMPGLAITDHGTIAGVPEFFRIAEKYPDIKPIAGCEFWVGDKGAHRFNHLILLAKNLTGYLNLVKLVSYAHTEGMCTKPLISKEVLEAHCEGLICLSACIGGEIPQMILQGNMSAAKGAAGWYRNLFGEDFYLEVSLHRNSGPMKLAVTDDRKAYRQQNRKLIRLQKKAGEGVFEIGRELGIKVVATNDVHFVTREDGIAHDIMLAISHNKRVSDPNRLRYSHLEYMKTEEEMCRLFPEHPEVIENTLEVLDKVERYSIWKDIELPKLSDRPEAELIEKTYAGAEKRFSEVCKKQHDRLEQELEIILSEGVAGYFLIIKDLVDWVRSKGWSVGPGRGAAAGSLVNYCLGITDIDPMKHGLLFERFYSKAQIAPPCIDLDLEPEAENYIQEYFKERYGRDCIAGITKFGQFGPKGALKKIRKAMGNPAAGTEVFRQALDAASRLSNVIEDEDVHACGWLIAPSAIDDFLPVQIQEGSIGGDYTLNSMYEAKYAEGAVLRLNILSFNVLKVIKDAFAAIGEETDILVEPEDISLDDELTLNMFARGDVVGVSLFGFGMMADYLKQLETVSFNDLVAMYAMTRPGPIDSISCFIARKRSEEKIVYDIPVVEEILGETCGLIVYQEQAMQLAERLAGFEPAKADKLRKALGKRELIVLEVLHDDFISGGMNNGYDKDALQRIWNLMDNPYAFNKSHAVCYTWLSYQFAWIKAHYPKIFYRILLNAHQLDREDVDVITADAMNHQVNIISPEKSKTGLFEVVE